MLQSTWVPDSRPSRCIVFGPIEEILALVPTADITEAYADTGEILYRWRGRSRWVMLRTEEVALPSEEEVEQPVAPPAPPEDLGARETEDGLVSDQTPEDLGAGGDPAST